MSWGQVFGELVLGLVFGSLAGLMSNLMSGMNGKDQQYMENMRALRQWLDEKKIPRTLKPRVLKYPPPLLHLPSYLPACLPAPRRELATQLARQPEKPGSACAAPYQCRA